MKIVYCIYGLFNSGGMERVIVNKANYFSNIKDYDVIIITTEQKNKPSFFHLSSKIKHYNLDINYSEDNNSFIFKKGFSFIHKRRKHKQQLKKLLIKLHADIVISTFGAETNFICSIPDGSKKILEIHFSKFFRLQYNRKNLWRLVDTIRSKRDEKVVSKFERFVVLTNEDKSYWNNTSNIRVIPNANFVKRGKLAALDNKKVISVGRLSYQKGYNRLIDVWKIVNQKHPDWILSIWGDGELKNELLKQIIELNLIQSIELQIPTKNIEEQYLNSSIFVLSSHYEGLPMVLLEAIAYGIPIISFDCKCGPKDIIDDGIDGFLVEEGNIQIFAEKLLFLIDNEKIRKEMGKSAYKKSMLFDENLIMKKWDSLFQELIG